MTNTETKQDKAESAGKGDSSKTPESKAPGKDTKPVEKVADEKPKPSKKAPVKKAKPVERSADEKPKPDAKAADKKTKPNKKAPVKEAKPAEKAADKKPKPDTKTADKKTKPKGKAPANEAKPVEKAADEKPKSAGKPTDKKPKPSEKTPNKEAKPAAKQNKNVKLDAKDSFSKLKKEFPHLNFKNTQRIENFHKELLALASVGEKIEETLKQEFEELSKAISEKISKNDTYQKELLLKTEEIIKNLEQALDSGKSEDAISLWDKVQGNISNTSGKIKKDLQSKIGAHKAKLDEFKDWKTFAATEKKKELTAQMKLLIESKMHASDRSKQINKMHLEWKNLGHSNLNESMWKEFKKLSDLAYEPCKEFFKNRKELMASNLKKRREICESLESAIENATGGTASHETTETAGSEANSETKDAADKEAENTAKTPAKEKLNTSQLGKLLSTYEADWKKYAPVEQSKIKTIQKRFYSGINKIRKLRKKAHQTNAKLKKQCVADAQALTELEDIKNAMTEAKKLQEQWKGIGSTSYREDEKYWKEFRAACDQIFSKRPQHSQANNKEDNVQEKEFNGVIAALEALFSKSESEFRDSRNEFQELSQKFSNSFDHQFKKRRKRLVDHYNSLKRKIEIRYASLPDKKQQELKAALMERSLYLNPLEESLLSCKDEKCFKDAVAAIAATEQSKWNELATPSQEKYLTSLDARFKSLSSTDSQKKYLTLALENEAEQRNNCIMTELQAEIDSPASDQALRMQIQLQLLQKGFGQAKLASKDDRKQLFETEMSAICVGPLTEVARKELEERMVLAINKLRQKIA